MKPCPETFPYPLIALDETDSTNRYISQLCNELQESVAELTTVTAEFQSAGKGQRGNTWEADKGKNLLFSFVLYPTFLAARRQFPFCLHLVSPPCQTRLLILWYPPKDRRDIPS